MTTTFMGGRRGPPEGGERPLRGLPGGRARPRPEPPSDADQPDRQPPEDDRPGGQPSGADDGHERPSGGVVRPLRPLRPLRVIPGGAGPPLRVIPGGAEPAPPAPPDADGHAPGTGSPGDRPRTGAGPEGHRGRAGTEAGPRPGAGRRTGVGRLRVAPRRRWLAAVVVLALLAGLAVTGRVLADRPEAGPASTAAAPTPSAAPPVKPSPVVATVGIGGFSYGMAAGAGSLWVAGSDQVTRIDQATNQVTATIPVAATGSGPAAVAFGAGAVWVPVAVPGALWVIDPARNQVTARIPLGGPLGGPISVSATRGAVWVACCGGSGSGTPGGSGSAAQSASGPGAPAAGTLYRIDPRRERVVASIPLTASPMAVAADPSAAWVAAAGGRVLMVSAKRNRVVTGIDAGGDLGFSQTIAVGAGAVWLAEPFDEQVVRIDPKSRRVKARIPAGAATTLAVTADDVWALSSLGLVRIDPARDRVVAVAGDPDLRRARLIAADGGALWTAGWSSVSRIAPDLVTP